ncbi:MAG: M48 family metallopeptidase [Pseudomonadota bacterium]
MIKLLLPILIAGGWALAMYWISIRQLSANLDRNSEPIDDPKLEAMVRRMGRQVGIDHLRAHLFRMDAINGLAAPDGRIFVTTGLFDRYRRGMLTAEEVASVIAHELGHVARGHHKRRLIDWTGQNAAKMALGMLLSRIIPVIGYYIANFLTSILMAKLSRRDEFEADEYASALMVSAGLGVEPQISMFQKLSKLSPGGTGVAWLMSHPPTEDRIAVIEERSRGWSDKVEDGV